VEILGHTAPQPERRGAFGVTIISQPGEDGEDSGREDQIFDEAQWVEMLRFDPKKVSEEPARWGCSHLRLLSLGTCSV